MSEKGSQIKYKLSYVFNFEVKQKGWSSGHPLLLPRRRAFHLFSRRFLQHPFWSRPQKKKIIMKNFSDVILCINHKKILRERQSYRFFSWSSSSVRILYVKGSRGGDIQGNFNYVGVLYRSRKKGLERNKLVIFLVFLFIRFVDINY